MSLKLDEYLYTKASKIPRFLLAKCIAITLFLRKGPNQDGTLTSEELEGLRKLVSLITAGNLDEGDAVEVANEYVVICGNFKHCQFDAIAKHNILATSLSPMAVIEESDYTYDIKELVFYIDNLIDQKDELAENLSIVAKLERLE